ncbi:MAG: AbrB/MazE/SpoVT family DNA-binding domain-containing protein [Gammaproteobacteria bacterium]|nr:AbrB/MazE/SpoVT family DNA-binding domain-containing protein [Gammaproteobacteria bacterium]MDE0271684.1 AbrB/MazE/SpoVT family DNA-binding domain-containing protein [Gammaproteobacteria bacterium]
MEARISKWGNSLALRIPKLVAAQVGLRTDSVVDLSPQGEKLIVSLVESPPRQLEALLAEVTEENIHGEVDTGPPVGRELW